MNVQQLTESMHGTSVVTPLDLDRVTRDGRRIRTRRRAAIAGGVAAAVAAVAVPVALWQEPQPAEPRFAGTPSAPAYDDARERAFERDAPLGQPLGAVLQPGGAYAPKFYLGGDKVRSVGALSVWADPEGLAFGARLLDGDGSLRKAGALDVPLLEGTEAVLHRVPFQNADEPTFVGVLAVPDGTRLRDLVVRARGEDSAIRSGVRGDVVPGRALVWVTAGTGSDGTTTLGGWSVRDPEGRLLARGTFEGPTTGTWQPMP